MMARDDMSPELVAQLRILGNNYGPMGVALAAADMTDIGALMAILGDEVERTDEPIPAPEIKTLTDDLAALLNMYGTENGSNTPDFILADYMMDCLRAFETASRHRERWYGKRLSIGGVVTDLTAEEAPS